MYIKFFYWNGARFLSSFLKNGTERGTEFHFGTGTERGTEFQKKWNGQKPGSL